VLNARTA